MAWSPQQDAALSAVAAWLADPRAPQIFRLFGFAGTGKTTLAKAIRGMVRGTVLYATFTGKAALVLASKGCDNATTIHSLIYKVDELEDGTVNFILNTEKSALRSASLLVIDEVSMVGPELAEDLLSFGVRVLVLGDPAQLPPVSGTGYFTEVKPDVMLTEIHRQAADNPIIRMSMDVREGRKLCVGAYGDSKIITRRQQMTEDVLAADQVLCGLNKSRRQYNGRIRDLRGYSGEIPQKGERLVCLKNRRKSGFLNGGLWAAEESKLNASLVSLELRAEDVPAPVEHAIAHVPVQFFDGTEDTLDPRQKRHYDEFTFGYVLTCHKSQGSQWGNVFVFNESAAFREHASRWLYTAITRASERLTLVQ